MTQDYSWIDPVIIELIGKKVGKELPEPWSEYYLDIVAEARQSLIAGFEKALVEARIDEIDRNDYLFNKNLGSQHRIKERLAELEASLSDKEPH